MFHSELKLLCLFYNTYMSSIIQIVYLSQFIIFRCGSGLSGEVLTEQGHYWVGFDISKSMLGMNISSIFILLKLIKIGPNYDE